MTSIELQALRQEKTYSDESRKLLGVHYTPDLLVDYIVSHTLNPLIKSSDTFSKIRIIDPACGSGLFLLKAYEILAVHWQKTFGKFGPKDTKHILENCLFGVDINEQAVLTTRKHLLAKAGFSENDCINIDKNIIVADALLLRPSSMLIPLHEDGGEKLFATMLFPQHSFDCVIGNPPYVRIQNTSVEKRGHYASFYASATGRFDIASLFVELSEYLLNEKGRLGFVISNKILSTSGARKIRLFLLRHFSIEEIVDLTDTKLFEAAVLPMILIAKRTDKNKDNIAYTSITESHGKVTDTTQVKNLQQFLSETKIPLETSVLVAGKVFQAQRFYTTAPSLHTNVWTFHNERQHKLLSKLRQNSICTVGNLSEKISVGLKTTADNVFIKPMTKTFVQQKALEKELVFPVLESHNIARWNYLWDSNKDLFILYPHIEKNGKVIPVALDDYPQTKKYLEAHRPQLESRSYLSEGGRRWYEIWVHQSPSDFARRKIITPDIASSNRFAIDDNGLYVNGTCFYIILSDNSDASYYSILGLLNSKVIEYFHKTTSGNSLYAKRFRYWSAYIQEYPVPERLRSSSHLRSLLIRNVANLLDTSNESDRADFEKENDRICYELFDLTEEDVMEIEQKLLMCRPPSRKKGISGK